MSHLLHPLVTCHTTNSNTLQITLTVMLPLLHSRYPVTYHTTNTIKIPVTCHVTPPASYCHLSSIQHKQFLSLGILPPASPCLLSYNQHMSISCHVTPPTSPCLLSYKQQMSIPVMLHLLHLPGTCQINDKRQIPSCYSFYTSGSPVKLTTNVKFLSCHTSQIDGYPPFSLVMGSVIAPCVIKRINLSPLLKIKTVLMTQMLQCSPRTQATVQ